MNSESFRLRARAIHCDSVSASRENAITTATIHSVYEVGSRNYAWPRMLLMTKPVLLRCLRRVAGRSPPFAQGGGVRPGAARRIGNPHAPRGEENRGGPRSP